MVQQIKILKGDFLDEVIFLNNDGSEGAKVRAYGEKMAVLMKILRTIGWIFTGCSCFKAKLIEIPGERRNYLYDTTLRSHLEQPPAIITKETIANLIQVAKASGSQSSKKAGGDDEMDALVKDFDVEDLKRAAQEMHLLKKAADAGKFKDTKDDPKEMMRAYVERRMQISQSCTCFVYANPKDAQGSFNELLVGYFKNQNAAWAARNLLELITDQYTFESAVVNSKHQATYYLPTGKFPAIDDPLKLL